MSEPVDVEAIRERWAKATPGPWMAYEIVTAESVPHGDWLEWHIWPESKYPKGHWDNDEQIAVVAERAIYPDPTNRSNMVFLTDEDKANATAIAHAPKDIAALLAEVSRLQAELRAVQERIERLTWQEVPPSPFDSYSGKRCNFCWCRYPEHNKSCIAAQGGEG